MGACQSKCVPKGCLDGPDVLPPLKITSETHSNLTLLRVHRKKVEALIPDGMALAPKEELAKYYPAIGDDFVVGLQMDRNKDFSPIVGPFGSLDFDMFMVIVPFCILEGHNPINQEQIFWTYRNVMLSSSWAAEALTSIGYRASFHHGKTEFFSSDSSGSYEIGLANHEISTSSWAAGQFHSPTKSDKADPGVQLILALLKQPWTADKHLRKGSYYEVDIDSIQFRKCEDVKVHLDLSAFPGFDKNFTGDFDGSVLASVEVKIPELRESLPFNIDNVTENPPPKIEDHINDDGNIDHVLTSNGCKSLSKIQNICDDAFANGKEPDFETLKAELTILIKAEGNGHFRVWEALLRKNFAAIKSNNDLTSIEQSGLSLGKVLQQLTGNGIWKNVGGNVEFSPKYIRTANTFDDIINVLSAGRQEQVPVKAVGTGHSYSCCMKTSGYLLKTSGTLKEVANLNKPITGQLSAEMLYEEYRNKLQIHGGDLVYSQDSYDINTVDEKLALFECESGITVNELIHVLEKNNLGLQNMGGAAWQTIAGYCSTSTHGSGVRFGPVAEGIKSLVLVTTGEWKKDDWDGSSCRIKYASSGNQLGEKGVYVYRIEPYNGITNANAYDDATVSLLQCDDVFNSVRTSFGAFGIIYSITLQVQQFYWLEQTVTETTWDAVMSNQLAPNKENPGALPLCLTEPRNSMLYWSPYSNQPYHDLTSGVSSHHTVLWFQSSLAEKPKDYKFNPKIAKKKLAEDLARGLMQGSSRPTISNFIVKIMGEIVENMFEESVTNGALKDSPLTKLEKLIVLAIQKLQITYDLTALLFKVVPGIIPFLTNAAMQTQILEGNKSGKYYFVMLLNVAQNAGFATEYTFPLQQPVNNDLISHSTAHSTLSTVMTGTDAGPYAVWPTSIGAAGDYTMDNVKKGIDIISEEAGSELSAKTEYFTSPMGVRFVKNSLMPLSMMHGSDACTIELDMAYGTPDGYTSLKKIGPQLLGVGARFHWGLSIDEGQSDAESMQQAYPEINTWSKVADQFNREKTFTNEFLAILGLAH